jgi:serine phosphatase RsbU (regulator of sigma subunit)
MVNPAGVDLGQEGLMEMVRPIDDHSPEAVGAQLVAAIRDFRGDQEALDDQTIIVVAANEVMKEAQA